jgi:equilibrative nucleoside transporter 1/2/3
MNFILNVVFQFILIFFGKGFSYKTLITACLIVSAFSLISLPIVVPFIRGLAGFLLTSFIFLLQGLANAIVLSCFYGIIGYMPDKYRVAFSTGSGIAGVLMNLIKYLVLIIFGDNDDDEKTIILSSIIFFIFSVVIVFISLVCLLVNRYINLDCL